ncbi:S24 family peptidase [Rhizobium leguminosarum]|uniref:S24 family peptidase n=1 Tax=Rhizobium leguminosarum TaxID=384 RepID=UPI0002FB5FF4|nr:S24 family peptidase [Rhizobium leguminosarum]
MNDFLAPAIPAEKIMSSRLRIHMVDSDGMAPALLPMRDYVLIAPIQGYHGDGVYLIDLQGGSTLYRVQNMLGGQLRLSMDNPLYGSFTFTKAQFEEIVLGIVVADIKVRNERFLVDSRDN